MIHLARARGRTRAHAPALGPTFDPVLNYALGPAFDPVLNYALGFVLARSLEVLQDSDGQWVLTRAAGFPPVFDLALPLSWRACMETRGTAWFGNGASFHVRSVVVVVIQFLHVFPRPCSRLWVFVDTLVNCLRTASALMPSICNLSSVERDSFSAAPRRVPFAPARQRRDRARTPHLTINNRGRI